MSCNTSAKQSEGAMGAAGVPASQAQAAWANPGHCPKCGAFISPGQPCKRCAGSPAQGKTGANEAGDGRGWETSPLIWSDLTDEEKQSLRENPASFDLRGANLQGANLSGAILYGANLSGANLSGANLSAADLRKANLSEVNLSGAILYGADLSRVSLSGANLSGANLSVAILREADLSGANLSEANLSIASLARANLTGCNLKCTQLLYSDLSRADLSGADLAGACLTGVNLTNATLFETNLSGANLDGADLSRADLIGACLAGVNLASATLFGTNLSGANLDGVNLQGAQPMSLFGEVTDPTQVQEQSPEEAGTLPPMTKGRRMRPDIRKITTARLSIELNPGQVFAETPRAWEIWQEEPLLRRVKRIRKNRVFWVVER